jgi:hypothetical protein
MKKILLSLVLLFTGSLLWNTVSAQYYILPRANENNPVLWQWTTDAEKVPEDWFAVDFDTDEWEWDTDEAGFGYSTSLFVEGAVRTALDDATTTCWIRKKVTFDVEDIANLRFELIWDEDPEVYFNGVKAFQATGWKDRDYNDITANISQAALKALNPKGENTIAIHFINKSGGFGLDFAIFCNEESDDPYTRLSYLVGKCEERPNAYQAGEDPGCYPEDLVVEYEIALADAQDALENEDDDAMTSAYNTLKDILDRLDANMVPITDGLYYLKGGPNLVAKRGYDIGIRGVNDNSLMWGPFDGISPDQVWEIKRLESGNFSIQNYALKTYIGYMKSEAFTEWRFVDMTEELEAEQVFKSVGGGVWWLGNTKRPNNVYGFDCWGGSARSSYVGALSDTNDEVSQWTLVKVPEDSLAIINPIAEQYGLSARLEALLDPALTAYNACFTYDTDFDHALITDASQFSASSSMDGLEFASLIDVNSKGNLNNTTAWGTTVSSAGMTEHQYLEVAFKDPVETFTLKVNKASRTPAGYSYNSQQMRPRRVVIYASNTEEEYDKEWTKIEEYYPTVLSSATSDEHTVVLGKPYKYLKYSVFDTESHYRQWNFVYFVLGAFQAYPATPNEEYSQYTYIPGMKSACDELATQLANAREKVSANTAKEEDITALKAAIDGVRALMVDTMEIFAKIQEVKEYSTTFGAGLDYGQVEDSDMDAINAALEEADKWDHKKPMKDDIAKRITDLETAFQTFKAAQKSIEFGKWYYISSTDQSRDGNTDPEMGGSIYHTIVNGNVMYPGSNNSAEQRLKNGVDNLRQGHYDRELEDIDDIYNPYLMWRAVNLGDTAIALQNRGTGTYIAVTRNNNRCSMSETPAPYDMQFVAPGEVRFVCSDPANTAGYALYAAYDLYVAGNASELGKDEPTTWTFIPVEEDITSVMIPVTNNTISIMTLPYEQQSFSYINEDMTMYSVKGVNGKEFGEEKLILTPYGEDDVVAAGEPFILVVGDPNNFDPENVEEVALAVMAPEAFATEALTKNALVGVLHGFTPGEEVYGYFENNELKRTPDYEPFIEGHTGYIDLSKLSAAEAEGNDIEVGPADKLLEAVKTAIAVKNAGSNDVYSIEGKLVSKNGVKNLQKGIYIVGKKKVAVK